MDYANWCALSDQELARRDIAEVNLLCALGLPGSEGLNPAFCLDRLDKWTEQVRAGIDHALKNRSRYPIYDELSEAEYCILTMYAVLYRHVGLTVNTECQNPGNEYDAFDSRDHFIHAVLQDGHPATCCAAPVIFTAIGRRLGYPIKVVKARQHLFCRWDELGGERFNIEATNQGYYQLSDDYYRSWPFPSPPELVEAGGWLQSVTPSQELAVFLKTRAECLIYNLQLAEAVQASYFACQIDPHDHFHRNQWKIATLMYRAELQALTNDPREWRIPIPRKPWEAHVYSAARALLNQVVAAGRQPKQDQVALDINFEVIVAPFQKG